jgi:hypothetical protein
LTLDDDFSPIAERGELERASGLLSRLQRRQELRPVSANHYRVLVDGDGTPLTGAEELSAGQRYWSKANGWVTVDVGDHILAYDVPFSDPSGRIGFVATVTLQTKVRDATAVVERGIESVKDVLGPALREVVTKATRSADGGPSTDPIGALSAMRERANENMQQEVRKELGNLPEWLSAQVTAVTVEFDADTAAHRAELVRRSRDGELIDADAENKKRGTRHEMEVREIVRDSLAAHLSQPATRAFEVVFSDPSAENIASVVNQVNADEHRHKALVIEILQGLIDKDLVDKGDGVFDITAETILKALQGKVGPDLNEIEGISPGGGDEVVGEVVDEQAADPRDDDADSEGDDGEDGDQDWTDR